MRHWECENLERHEYWLRQLIEDIEPWELAEFQNIERRNDAFSRDLKFGTGGIRCLMGVGPNRMNRLTIGRVAQGLACWLRSYQRLNTVAVVYDTRIHSRTFAEVTAGVLASNDINVMLADSPQPTPVLSYLVRNFGCSAGVVITASHNPREYNGFKVYDAQGVQATDAMTSAIQAEIESVDPFVDVQPMNLQEAINYGLVSYVSDQMLDAYYTTMLQQRFGWDCSDIKVVYSPLHGTGLAYAERIFHDLGVSYSLVEAQAEPDGNYPYCPKPNPENPDAMYMGMEQTVYERADLFMATDPDADRVGVACMDNGIPRLLTGNEVGLLLLDFFCRHHRSEGKCDVAVTTIVTTPLADEIAVANRIELRRTLTGFKYIGEQIGQIEGSNKSFLLGIEESDGYLCGSYVRDKDGICGLMLLCEIAAYYKGRGQTLSEALESMYERYGYMLGKQLSVDLTGLEGQITIEHQMRSLRMNPPRALAGNQLDAVVDYLTGVLMPIVNGESNQELPSSNVLEWRYSGGSRVLIRPSGTEPKLKAYVFAKAVSLDSTSALLESMCNELSSLLQYTAPKESGWVA